jgi:hypothetical protein
VNTATTRTERIRRWPALADNPGSAFAARQAMLAEGIASAADFDRWAADNEIYRSSPALKFAFMPLYRVTACA